MFSKKAIYLLLLSTLILIVVASLGAAAADSQPSGEDLEKVQLGKSIFFDENLSINQNQSCASCHGLEVGFSGPLSETNADGAVYEGSVTGEFGDRKPPSAAYATQSPVFHEDNGIFIGGNFWDGRATGDVLGNPAADQAQGPFLNPVEQALPNSDEVVTRVCTSTYADLFKGVWGDEICDAGKEDDAFDSIALSIAEYEASKEVNAFSSKYDLSLSGRLELTEEEEKGKVLFNGAGKCDKCHISDGEKALFTDYTFSNLGVPKNPENPIYNVNPAFVDPGLGGFLKSTGDYDEAVYMAQWGKQKVPTMRNVDKRPSPDFVKAFTHNGYFKTLEGIVHFYNTRDIEEKGVCPEDYTEAQALAANCWPPPEVAENVDTELMGDLGLSPEEEAAIVAFMKTLSDEYFEVFLPVVLQPK